MPASGYAAPNEETEETIPRRVRHLTSVQVANFTPFPVRDEFTSAMSKPSEHPQYAEHGHLSDDFDVTLGRSRGRRRSSTILLSPRLSSSHDSLRIPQDVGPSIESTSRKGTPSRASAPGSKARASVVGPPLSRPALRQRTISSSSTNSRLTIHEAVMSPNLSSASALQGILRDTSQPALEKILSSRLVETFITITIPDQHSPEVPDGHFTVNKVLRRNTVSMSNGDDLPRTSTPKRNALPSVSFTSPKGPGSSLHGKSMSTSSSVNGHHPPNLKPSSPKHFATKSSSARPQISPRTPTASSSRSPTPDRGAKPLEKSIPDYLSPIHRPSVNPSFHIDARTGSDFAPGTNLSGRRMIIEIWAHQSNDRSSVSPAKGKGKGRAGWSEDTAGDSSWGILQTWDVELNDLLPVSDGLVGDTSRLPPNTLCIELDPPGKMFYLPTSRNVRIDASRSPSPTGGYNSDPESNLRSVKSHTPRRARLQSNDLLGDSHTATYELGDDSRFWKKGRLKSGSWQDLLKLVTLQTVIRDTEQSLSDVVREVQTLVIQNALTVRTREASERQAQVGELHGNLAATRDQCSHLKARVAAKSRELEQRRELLRQAREAHTQDLHADDAYAMEVARERERLSQLRNRLPAIRNALVTNLASIYPIELISPPDLLFGILEVPLPIPIGTTDPAPPLSIPSRKDINEDTVATALGYAAQVVQHLAAYLGQGLTYPVTYVGSRSLIKDGISTMVGPRMFPLFSKGVDTYRFEYGVFLLNKDIELLMSERNLRALDVRHTLPNLKNLLLTLTDPDTADPRPHRSLSVASSTLSALQSPLLVPTAEVDSTVPDLLDTLAIHDPTIDKDPPSPSGSTTPTKSISETPLTPTNTIKKPRGFLSGFFKARQPSEPRFTAKAESSSSGEQQQEEQQDVALATANGDASQSMEESTPANDDDDRRTIRASTSEVDIAESKTVARANGHVNGNRAGAGAAQNGRQQQGAVEKTAGDVRAPQIVDVSHG